jgi:peroxiredoxin
MRRVALLLGATILISMAAALVITAGLPSRAAYTGWIIDGGRLVAPEINALAPPFELPSLDESLVELARLRGAPVVINFWATWCAPCRVEMPELQQVYETHQATGLRILAVNLGEPAPVVQEWVDTMGLTFDILLDGDQAVSMLYRVRVQPSTFIISPQGNIVQIFHGPVTVGQLEAVLTPWLSW